MGIKIKLLHPKAKIPTKESRGAAGFDLYACLDNPINLYVNCSALVPCGFAINLVDNEWEKGVPEHLKSFMTFEFEAQIRPRSGLAAKHKVTVLNSPGTIDSDYRGEVKVLLINHGDGCFRIEHGDRIAQMVIQPVNSISLEVVDELDDTERGEGGFGSTGV